MTNQRREQRARFGAPSLDALIDFMLDNVMSDGTSHMVYYGSGEPNVALSSLAMDIVEHKASVDAAMIMAAIREIEEIGWPLEPWQLSTVIEAISVSSAPTRDLP